MWRAAITVQDPEIFYGPEFSSFSCTRRMVCEWELNELGCEQLDSVKLILLLWWKSSVAYYCGFKNIVILIRGHCIHRVNLVRDLHCTIGWLPLWTSDINAVWLQQMAGWQDSRKTIGPRKCVKSISFHAKFFPKIKSRPKVKNFFLNTLLFLGHKNQENNHFFLPATRNEN